VDGFAVHASIVGVKWTYPKSEPSLSGFASGHDLDAVTDHRVDGEPSTLRNKESINEH
jgi:hypothetical protein